jgi:hypothetical protein
MSYWYGYTKTAAVFKVFLLITGHSMTKKNWKAKWIGKIGGILSVGLHCFYLIYRKVISSRLSWLVAHQSTFNIFMKGKFDACVLWLLTKSFQNWIVDQSTARNFTVIKMKLTNFLLPYFLIYFPPMNSFLPWIVFVRLCTVTFGLM